MYFFTNDKPTYNNHSLASELQDFKKEANFTLSTQLVEGSKLLKNNYIKDENYVEVSDYLSFSMSKIYINS